VPENEATLLGGRVIENPVSGERIVIRSPAAQTGGGLLAWELFLAPGGRVPSSHAHPQQEELFTVVDGLLRFRVGGHRTTLRPGESVRVSPGRVHSFANPGHRTAHVLVETRPALSMQELLETAAAMAAETQQRSWLLPSVPRPHELVLFMRDFEGEVAAPYLPAGVVRAVIGPLAWLVRRCRADRRYRRWRQRAALPLPQRRPTALSLPERRPAA
jgi:quercetin dioxygenase-like cupin family protein